MISDAIFGRTQFQNEVLYIMDSIGHRRPYWLGLSLATAMPINQLGISNEDSTEKRLYSQTQGVGKGIRGSLRPSVWKLGSLTIVHFLKRLGLRFPSAQSVQGILCFGILSGSWSAEGWAAMRTDRSCGWIHWRWERNTPSALFITITQPGAFRSPHWSNTTRAAQCLWFPFVCK